MRATSHNGRRPMPFIRWLPTFLAFPLGGLLAFQVVGSSDAPDTAALAGALAGAIIGTAQWLALRSRPVTVRWIAHTTAGMAAGSAFASVLTDAGTSASALFANG